VLGDTSGLPGFCSSATCSLSIVANNALQLSNGSGALDVAFNAGHTFQTLGSNPISFVSNFGQTVVFGFFPGNGLPSTGGLNVLPALVSEQWSANASIGGVPIVGGFLYDPIHGTIVSSSTSIAGFCSSATCSLSIVANNALRLSNGSGALDVAFNAGPTFQTLGSNPISFVSNFGQTAVLGFFPGNELPSTGSLNVLPAALSAPAPAPGVGLASLLALVGAMFCSRRLREGGA
jgi:hypothetical protein